MNTGDIFAFVLEQLPDGVIILDAGNNILFVNSMAEKIRRIAREDKIHANVIDCHPERSHEKVERALKYLKKKKTSFKRMVNDHMANKIYENVYKAIYDSSENVIGSIVISKDITEKYHLEQEKLKNTLLLQEQVSALTEQLNNLFLSSLTTIVNTLEAKDAYTKGHSIRVTNISKEFIVQAYGQIQLLLDIDIAGKVHDVGKIGIKEAILNKPEQLTQEEYEHIKTHPLITERILSPIQKLKGAITIAKHHHERFDGKGYPDGLKGDTIPLGARILAIADTYDAMTSSRPYRTALRAEDAIKEIGKNLGTQFDPDIGKTFIDLIESGTIG